MSRNTSRSFLMYSSDGTSYSKLVDVKEIPAVRQAPNMLDDTSLSDDQHTYIPDILDSGGGLEFTANYTSANLSAVSAVANTEAYYAIWFGGTESGGVITPDGSEGKWAFKGICSEPWFDAMSVGAVHDLKFSIAPTSKVTVG